MALLSAGSTCTAVQGWSDGTEYNRLLGANNKGSNRIYQVH